MQEITAPLATLPDDAVEAAAAATDFPVVLRGYDRLAVDAYVRKANQLIAELQSTHSPEVAVRRALERVGQETAGILQRAHETADELTRQSRSEAEERLERARQEAAQITVDARARLKDLDAETDRIWAERHRIVEDTKELARQLLALTESASERFPAAEEQLVEPATAAAAANGLAEVEPRQVFNAEGEGEVEDEDGQVPELEAAGDTQATQVIPPVGPAENGASSE
jgi:hypothetical protein